ncbi:MAG: hypothetical protein JXA30_16700 [Deltaproteobacteria bacterium]|nr:hypothetical protein [Deltaproteobacteria bacterium]
MARMRLLFLVTLFLVAQSTTTAAQEYGTNLRLFGQFILGVAGSVDGETEAGGFSQDFEGDLDPSIGFGAGADFGLHEYFALGGIFRYFSISPEDAEDSSSAIDIDALPRLRYPFEQGEVYFAIPVGLTIFIPDEGDAEVGWNLNFVLGGLYKLTEQFGLFAEVGYFLHFASSSEEDPFSGTEIDVSSTIGQIGIAIGAAYIN